MSNKYNISLVTGDGIGPEISESALSILETINDNFSLQLEIKKLEAGDTVLKNTGNALPDETFEAVKNSGPALRYASDDLKGNKDVLLEAVKNWGYALRYASEELKGDKELVLEAFKKFSWYGYIDEFKHVDLSLKNNPEFLLEIAQCLY